MHKRRREFSVLTWKKMNTQRNSVPVDRFDILKGSLPQDPPAHHWNTEYPRMSEESEMGSKNEAAQKGMDELDQIQRGNR